MSKYIFSINVLLRRLRVTGLNIEIHLNLICLRIVIPLVHNNSDNLVNLRWRLGDLEKKKCKDCNNDFKC